jgi:hypothetical protein
MTIKELTNVTDHVAAVKQVINASSGDASSFLCLQQVIINDAKIERYAV